MGTINVLHYVRRVSHSRLLNSHPTLTLHVLIPCSLSMMFLSASTIIDILKDHRLSPWQSGRGAVAMGKWHGSLLVSSHPTLTCMC